jgi:hypothetical protein
MSEEKRFFTYETEFCGSLELQGQPAYYITGFLTGYDEITEDNLVPYGFSRVVLTDLDAEQLWGEIEWIPHEDGQDGGVMRIKSGTGKWKGAEGELKLMLYLTPADMRDGGHARAVLDGEGEISLFS